MLLHNILSSYSVPAEDTLFIEDVFNVALYSGNGSARSIATGIDLSGDNAGLIWLKSRSAATDHALYDTARGATYDLVSNSTAAQTTQTTGLTSFNADGFSLGALAKLNTNAATYVAWTFKKATKFFDVVSWTGNGVAGRQIPHSLGVAPGMIVVKENTAGMNWLVYHRSNGAGKAMELNLTGAAWNSANTWVNTSPTDSYFVVGGDAQGVNTTGKTYIAYLWAHDDSADGVVQCGSFAPSAGAQEINLGWEPQYLMMKSASYASTGWVIWDNMRGLPVIGTGPAFYADTSWEENVYNWCPVLTSTGFKFPSGTWTTVTQCIYLAIRRGPMRVPTDGTKVYNAIARTGTGAAAAVTGVGFAPDAVICSRRSATGTGTRIEDRLRGATQELVTEANTAETAVSQSVTGFDVMDGFKLWTDTDWNASSGTFINQCFRRAPGFFDIVCYTGTGVARTVAHNLGSVPGMIWVKCRSNTSDWVVYHKSSTGTSCFLLTTTPVQTFSGTWNNTDPTAKVFSLGTFTDVNYSGRTYVAYLFGDTDGLCKAFSYTGNGANQDIALGFVPRFIILKRTDSTGNWFVYDTVRGIVSGNDPYLLLNSTAAEFTTTDYIDPIATGFNVSETVLNINSATYIGWACA